jgi:AcrR family transcriptional regulator
MALGERAAALAHAGVAAPAVAAGVARVSHGGVASAPQAYDDVRRAQLVELQRARIVRAMVDVSCELGAGSVTVTHVVERSGVSRRTFYEVFEDREACFLAAFEQTLAQAMGCVLPAYRAVGVWRERVRGALLALLGFLDEQPRLGRVLVVESMVGGPRVLARRNEIVARLVGAIDEGVGEAKNPGVVPPLTGEGLVGGVLAIIHARLLAAQGAGPAVQDAVVQGHAGGNKGTGGEHAPGGGLLGLVNPLMSTIVMPYLGPAAARRELDRAVSFPVVSQRESVSFADPFKEAGMRLTYRTVRVLLAVAEHGGGSNREIGDAAGVGDQGQISKLLGRLARAGLIENSDLHPGMGAPNAWALSAIGRRVVSTLRSEAVGPVGLVGSKTSEGVV